MADPGTGWLGDPQMIFAAALGAFVLTVGAVVLTIVAVAPRMRLRRRMADMGIGEPPRSRRAVRTRDPEQRRIQERLRELEAKGKQRRRNFQLRTVMVRAGIDMGFKAYIVVSGLAGVVAALVAFVFGYPIFIVMAVGVGTALLLPRLVLGIISSRRQAKFTRDFPNAIDILVRGIRSGLPVTECLEIIGREMPDPLGEEFRRLVDGQKMGITLDQLLIRALERMPTPEFKFFAIVIQIQQQIGGSLADTLSNLSNVLRERKQMRDKAHAMAAEGKTSAAIIGCIPIVLALILSAINQEYMSPFFASLVGKILFYGGLIWMGLGIFVMRAMINFRI